jgi:hypothetical protein
MADNKTQGGYTEDEERELLKNMSNDNGPKDGDGKMPEQTAGLVSPKFGGDK